MFCYYQDSWIMVWKMERLQLCLAGKFCDSLVNKNAEALWWNDTVVFRWIDLNSRFEQVCTKPHDFSWLCLEMSLYEIQFDFFSLKHKLVTIHNFDNNDVGYLATKSIDWAVALAFFLTVYLCREPCYSKYVWFASCQFCDLFLSY